jgi:two-component system, chemotaxis family, chemotaxis protein CheY
MWTDRGSARIELALSAPRSLEESRGYGGRLLSFPFPEEAAPRPAPQEPVASAAVRQACRVLVVDDDIGIRLSLAALLEDEGYIVETATHGKEALEHIAQRRPRVVLLDMRMPIMDGWAFARELRAQGLDLPLVVMTAARDAAAWAEEVAATAFAPKPFDYPALLEILDRLCGRRTD